MNCSNEPLRVYACWHVDTLEAVRPCLDGLNAARYRLALVTLEFKQARLQISGDRDQTFPHDQPLGHGLQCFH